jgi:hypothetical protein
MEYFDEIKQIINKYARIKNELAALEEQTKALTLKKNQLEFELSVTREKEISLIDKIRLETGSEPDFYQIIQELSNGTVELL